MILETERGEFINITNIKVFEIKEKTLIIHDFPQKKIYTLTDDSVERLIFWINEEGEE